MVILGVGELEPATAGESRWESALLTASTCPALSETLHPHGSFKQPYGLSTNLSHRWRSWDTDMLSHLPEITQLRRDRPGLNPRQPGSRGPVLNATLNCIWSWLPRAHPQRVKGWPSGPLTLQQSKKHLSPWAIQENLTIPGENGCGTVKRCKTLATLTYCSTSCRKEGYRDRDQESWVLVPDASFPISGRQLFLSVN